MASKLVTRDVLVNTGLVSKEVLVDDVSSLDGAVLHDVLLDLVNAVKAVHALAVVLVVVPCGTVGALLGALGGASTLRARWAGTVHVVLTRRDGVRSASRVVTVKTTSHETVIFPVSPSLVSLTSVAAHASQASEATASSNQLLSRDAGVLTLGDAPPVSDGFSGTKSPARTARGLVSDLGNGGALGTPLLSGVKAVRDRHGDGDVPLGERDCVWLGTAKPLGP
jgi:hypothetical protein